MTTLRSMSFGTILGAAVSALSTGRHLRHSNKIDTRVDVESLTIVGHRRFPYQLDGDYLGEVDRLAIKYEPDCIDIVLPVG